jgi:DNA repair exonuclease SbcCD nuclease subunit
MKAVIFSDMQYYHNPSKSQVLSDGTYTWLNEQLRITEVIFQYAIDNGVPNIIFGGDLFEEKNRINVQTYNRVWGLYKKWSKQFDYFILNTGNHDFYNENRDSSLLPFSSLGIDIVKETTNFAVGGNIVRVIPYGKGIGGDLIIPDVGERHYLVTHENIEGITVGKNEYVHGEPISRDLFRQWDLVFNGHIHKPQVVDNIVNIGSPMIQDWGEEGEVKRFIHLDGDSYKSIPINGPSFYTLDGLTEERVEQLFKDDKNFFRVNVEATQVSHKIFKKWNVSPHIIKAKKRELRLTKQGSVADEVNQYVDISETQLDKNKLKTLGGEIIHEGTG